MARRSLKDRNTRSVTKLGNKSYAVTIPIEFIRELGWQEKQQVSVSVKSGKVIIEDWQP